jgi:3-methyladenine DNA glycosylase/8-oxoguanine DNA glycosylase
MQILHEPTSLQISVPLPYDFLGCVNGHGWSVFAPFARGDASLHRVELLTSGKVVQLELSAESGPQAVGVSIHVNTALTPTEQAEVIQKVRWMLRLDEDFAEFYALCRRQGKQYLNAIGRGRLLRSPTLFEDAFKVLLTTNTTWRQTQQMTARTVNALGQPVPQRPDLRAFPTPAAVLDAGESFFIAEARLGYRSAAAIELAKRVAELEALRDSALSTPELRKRLLSFRGIGPYGAATLLMLLGRYEYLAVDSEVRAFTAKKYFAGEPGTPAAIEQLYTHWGRWQYLGYWLDTNE